MVPRVIRAGQVEEEKISPNRKSINLNISLESFTHKENFNSGFDFY